MAFGDYNWQSASVNVNVITSATTFGNQGFFYPPQVAVVPQKAADPTEVDWLRGQVEEMRELAFA